MEKALLGCMILEPDEVIPNIISEHKNIAEYFLSIRTRVVFNTIMELLSTGKAIDENTIIDSLKKKDKLDNIGGVIFVCSLADQSPSAKNYSYYADILRDYYVRRSLIIMSKDALHDAQKAETAEIALENTQKKVMSIAQDQAQKGERPTSVMVTDYLQKLQDSIDNPQETYGLMTGWADIDNTVKGLQPANIVVIAARPSVGKTSLAMNMARHVAVDQRKPVGVFSLEMSADALIQRMIHTQARCPKDDWAGRIDDLSKAASDVANAPLHIDDRSGLSVQQIAASARRMMAQHSIELLVVDYLQLIRSTKTKGTRNDEVTEISSGCKALAKDLNIPILLLSQINRSAEIAERKPRCSDLRDSGSIEQDADQIWFIYKDLEHKPDESASGVPVWISIDKNRDGVSGVRFPFVFLKDYTRFESGTIAEPLSGNA
tara:strand:- start:10559 stop:11857 length:1299 start_codon:yes stop_codon:yes gene_type:complete